MHQRAEPRAAAGRAATGTSRCSTQATASTHRTISRRRQRTPGPWSGAGHRAQASSRVGRRIQPGMRGRHQRLPGAERAHGSSASMRSSAMPRPSRPERISPTAAPAASSPACRGRARALDTHRHQPPLQQAAISRPRRQLLAHVAALGPGNAVQLVEAAFQQHGFLRLQVARRRPAGRARGDGGRNPRRRIRPGSGAAVSTRQPASARRGSGAAMAASGGARAPGGMHLPARPRHRAASPSTAAGSATGAAINAGTCARSAVQQQALAHREDEEIRQPLALRRQQRGPDGLARRRSRRRRWRRGPAGRRRGPRRPPPARLGRASRAIDMGQQVRRIGAALQPPPRPRQAVVSAAAVRILFITSTRIGDAVLSTGRLDHLMRAHPRCALHHRLSARSPRASSRRMPRLDRLIPIEKRRFGAALARPVVRRWPSRAGTWWWTCARRRSPGCCWRSAAR